MKDYNEDYFYMYAGGVNFPALDFIGPHQTSNMFKFSKEVAIDDQTVIPVGTQHKHINNRNIQQWKGQ